MTDAFFDAYIECLLWSSTDDEGRPLDERFDADDFDSKTLRRLRDEAAEFYSANEADLSEHGTDEQGGHDFWLTRNGHGAGFWDRGTGDVGRRLTEAARAYGSLDVYIGDDGKIHC